MFDDSNIVGLDFETYGSRNISDVGLANYVADPHFRPLIGRVVFEEPHRTMIGGYNLITGGQGAVRQLAESLVDKYIVAHNVPFEKAVLDWLGLHYPSTRFIDSGVVSLQVGAGAKLMHAAPQLVQGQKIDEGRDLIKKFCVPSKEQIESGDLDFDLNLLVKFADEWHRFGQYCTRDASLARRIVAYWGHVMTSAEPSYAALTLDMNERGWPVDMEMVHEMQRRYFDNMAEAEKKFRSAYDEHTKVLPDGSIKEGLNLNSLKQLKEWCEARGIKANSFDKDHVASLIKRLDTKLNSGTTPSARWEDYTAVLNMLRTKQILGGSSLKKLQTIIDTVSEDNRLRGQYFHAGAGQTMRTSGRSVQMQNLKRLDPDDIGDMDELLHGDVLWDNDELAKNLRQCFASSHPQGVLFVGDFSSVESRGLAYQAGAEWKLRAFRQGKDLYKVQAALIYGGLYEEVTKLQRQTGKVGELSCGYGAGGGAVQSFAAGMGVTLSEGEAAKLVSDWRNANPEIQDYWYRLHEMLLSCVKTKRQQSWALPYDGLTVSIAPSETPTSLDAQHPGVQSIVVTISHVGSVVLRRYFQGCYMRGNNVAYYKPSGLKSGALWSAVFKDPKTKQFRHYELYGGKLAGILTQSLCREIFFRVMQAVARWCDVTQGVELIGQFHDELVVDWVPGGISHHAAERHLYKLMTDPGSLTSFPLEAEIKSDYRYTK